MTQWECTWKILTNIDGTPITNRNYNAQIFIFRFPYNGNLRFNFVLCVYVSCFADFCYFIGDRGLWSCTLGSFFDCKSYIGQCRLDQRIRSILNPTSSTVCLYDSYCDGLAAIVQFRCEFERRRKRILHICIIISCTLYYFRGFLLNVG